MKKSYEVAIIIAVLFALIWRVFTWVTLTQIGYIGFAEDESGLISSVAEGSPAALAGLEAGDRIREVEIPSNSKRAAPGEIVTYRIDRSGEQLGLTIKAGTYMDSAILGVMGLAILFIGLFTYLKYQSRLSLTLLLYCLVMAIHWGGYPRHDNIEIETLTILVYTFLSIFLGSTILHFVLEFTRGRVISVKLLGLVYIPGFIGLILLVMAWLNPDSRILFLTLEPTIVTLFALIGGILLFRKFFKSSQEDKTHVGVGIACLGLLVANLPYLFSTFIPEMNFGNGTGALIYRLLFIAQPIAFAVAIYQRSLAVSSPHEP